MLAAAAAAGAGAADEGAAAGAKRASPFPMLPMPAALSVLERVADTLVGRRRVVRVAVARLVPGLVLAADVRAPCDIPSRACSRLDGYAVVAADGAGDYPVSQECRAGPTTTLLPLARGHVAYITTGAPLPPLADAVCKIEDTEALPERASLVRLLVATPIGEGVRPAGSDVARGELLLPAGHVLSAVDVGSLLLARVARVEVHAPPTVGVLSTGDEIVAAPLGEGLPSDGGVSGSGLDSVVWDCNKPVLTQLASETGCRVRDCGHIPDAGGLAAVRTALLAAAFGQNVRGPAEDVGDASDKGDEGGVIVLIVTGGVSMGDRDLVKPALVALEAEMLFGRLLMKPGKPATAALLLPPDGRGRPCLVFALPGNPVSATVCFHVLVAPVLRRIQGLAWPACRAPEVDALTVGEALLLDPERPEYHRALVWWATADEGGGLNSPALRARSTGAQASSRLQSMSRANALLWLPAGPGTLSPGSRVRVLLLGPVYARDALPPEATRPATSTATLLQQGDACSCGRHPPHVIEASPALRRPSSHCVPALLGVLTVSDSCSRGLAEDRSGPAVLAALREFVPALDLKLLASDCVPDGLEAVRDRIERWSSAGAGLIMTTGGTGFGPRDLTPEATLPLLERQAPGLVHAMLAAGLRHTPMASLSRYAAGTRGKTLIVNLPGSVKAVRECIEALREALPHALTLIRGS